MTHKNQETLPEKADFNGAAVINEQGEEIPITEEMVQDACDQLDNPKT
ncbi:MAG: PA1571 family protein [Porticoccaceae bacterium]